MMLQKNNRGAVFAFSCALSVRTSRWCPHQFQNRRPFGTFNEESSPHIHQPCSNQQYPTPTVAGQNDLSRRSLNFKQKIIINNINLVKHCNNVIYSLDVILCVYFFWIDIIVQVHNIGGHSCFFFAFVFHVVYHKSSVLYHPPESPAGPQNTS